MRNLYQTSRLLSKDEFKKIEKALEKTWSSETATFADTTKKWDKNNPPRGQCMTTAAVINDLLGGKLVYDKTNHHYWNQLPDGTWQDFTGKQFKTKVKLVVTKLKTIREVLTDEYALKNNVKEKFTLLKKRFQENYK